MSSNVQTLSSKLSVSLKKILSKKSLKNISLICLANSFLTSATSLAALNDASDIDLTRRLTAVGTGPYFGVGTTYDGSDLVVLMPNIHRDLALLKQNKFISQKLGDTDAPRNPYVQLSGIAEAQFIVVSQATNSVDLTASNIDLSAWVNNWITAYANFGIEYDESQKANFRMITALMTIGNLNITPLYFTVGQIFVPFGSFSTGTSDMGNLVRKIGRIYQKAASIGYYPGNGLHITAAVYNGQTKNSKTSNLDQFAGTISHNYNFKIQGIPSSYKVGASYTNNLADAQTTRAVFLSGAELKHFVPGTDLFGSFSVGPYTVRGEFITALKYFRGADILQKNHRIKPRGYQAELSYDTTIRGIASSFTTHYSELHHGVLASNLEHQFGLNGSFNILKYTLLSIEYSHRKSYHETNFIGNYATPDKLSAKQPPLNGDTVNAINGALNHRSRNVLVTTLDLFY